MQSDQQEETQVPQDENPGRDMAEAFEEDTAPETAEESEAAESAEAESEEIEGDAEAEPSDAEAEFAQQMRMVEALLFAAAEPLDEASLRKRLPKNARIKAILSALEDQYRQRGVILKQLAGRWAFTTAPDLKHMLEHHREVTRKLSRAATETLSIVAYHQPVTRAEIEDIRGVGLSKGTLDVLIEAGWVKISGRRRVPGRPVTYATTDEFLVHFALDSIDSLPGLEELRASGLLETIPASGGLPMPGEAIDDSPVDPLGEDDDGREFLEPLMPDPADAEKVAEEQATGEQAAAEPESAEADANTAEDPQRNA
ncbi:SMC-Scp complex subunit ScpB [Ferrovibrio sp.]|uniref:SMC-Scp complex subunit ScpB n=1 Tax=Ferrovibrio sp. TaxID=1917215 RepID=UPI003D11E84C